MESHQPSPEEQALRRLLKKKLPGLASLEMTTARQRPVPLAVGGGRMHPIFRLHASHKRRKNFIGHLVVDNVRVTEHADKAYDVDSSFVNLLGSAMDKPSSLI
jgi:hypothetical protein